ncbi:hypothetical protein P2T68_17010 [Pseudomonas sp. G11]|uniref:hypothetical protein n=1 Tax=Pseudomonas sp. G11 TaxID=528343 RepID=UPI002402BA2B|nr:hypothetical protein [Pseudomonas sp. G11]WEX18945.1 hypothetical protein P2T68_17010 [Pseudomonas sp. G11]
MSQFKPGDLALTIVDDPEIPAYSVVTLDSEIKKGESCLTWDDKPSVAPEDGWFVIHPYATAARLYANRELMPLRGDFAPEQQKSRELTT